MTIDALMDWISRYGYMGLYGLLAASILGPPVPDEFLMTFVGFLTHLGKLNPYLAVLFAAAGSITGITLTYWIGRLFHDRVWPKLEKHAGAQRIEKALRWYHWNGGVLLTIGYFIPGVRHLNGYIAGMSHLSYRRFAFFSYLGALLWVTTFITLGRTLGENWQNILTVFHHYTIWIGGGFLLCLGILYAVYRYRHIWGKALQRLFYLDNREK